MSEFEIPAEVIDRAVDIAHEALSSEEPPGYPYGDARTCVEAAAPFIARAAVVAELRRMADVLATCGDNELEVNVDLGWYYAEERLRIRANELEAGDG